MKDQFVTYEIALKLKELGFDAECLNFYDSSVLHYPNETGEYQALCKSDLIERETLAPLWQQVIDWLREKHNLHIQVILNTIKDDAIYPYYYYVMNTETKVVVGDLSIYFETYKEAREQAILKAIELIAGQTK